ncbi:MAG: hypothetical protein IT509_12300 [Rhodocyclaceae bacterium]|nr:hypothetical protein [Rhodocyclaceae bacterium]
MTKKSSLLVVVGATILGVIFVVVMVKLKQGPAHEGTKPQVHTVHTVDISPTRFLLQATGFGNVKAGDTWQAVSNVEGRVIWRDPDLKSGNLIAAKTPLLRIDPTRYELAMRAAKADVTTTEIELRQLEQEAANTRKLLALEKDRQVLAERELERARSLTRRNFVSETKLDEQEKLTLQQRLAVQSLENTLSLVPTRQAMLKARLAYRQTSLEQARENLADTEFIAPFDLRLDQVGVDLHQHINRGQSLFTADSIATAEATIQVPVPDLRRLLAIVRHNSAASRPDDALPDMKSDLNMGPLAATVSLAGNSAMRWQARVTRIASGLDPATRTVQVVLTVDEPYRNANSPEQVPLVRNMYVRGTLSALTPDPVLVVPAAAVHQGMVYLANADNRLERRPVQVAWSQRDLAVIGNGLNPGDRVILDQLVPAIDGMPIDPIPNPEAAEKLRHQASGEAL